MKQFQKVLNGFKKANVSQEDEIIWEEDEALQGSPAHDNSKDDA